jgi:uncharacterized protein (DUF1697 family)
MAPMGKWIALLRGINVGGNRKLPMATLREVFAGAGGEDVVTYIQSGNVVFRHRARSAPKLRADLEARIEATTGFAVPVILRTDTQLARVIEHNPYPTDEPTSLHVLFLDEPPKPGALEAIDRAAFAPEVFTHLGTEIYLHLPNGMGRAKLLVPIYRAVPGATARNWNSVRKLHELATA